MSDIYTAIQKLKEAQAEFKEFNPISVTIDYIGTRRYALRVLISDVHALAALPGELKVYKQQGGYTFPYGFEKVIDNVLFECYGTADEAAFYLGLTPDEAEEEAKSA